MWHFLCTLILKHLILPSGIPKPSVIDKGRPVSPSGVSSCRITERSSSTTSLPPRSSEMPWTCWGFLVCSCTWSGCAWLGLLPTAVTSRGWGRYSLRLFLPLRCCPVLAQGQLLGFSLYNSVWFWPYLWSWFCFDLALYKYIEFNLILPLCKPSPYFFLKTLYIWGLFLSPCTALLIDWNTASCPSSTRPMSSSSGQRTPGWWMSSQWWWPTA